MRGGHDEPLAYQGWGGGNSNPWGVAAYPKLLAFLCEAFLPSSGPVVLRCHSDARFPGASPASAATLSVCKSGCSYTQIAPAVVAANSGDTIRIGRGTYVGGVLIDTSLQLIGAGPGITTIEGDGGSVLTIGSYGATIEPTVTISGVTITGGDAQTSPESIPLFGIPGVWATGGGVDIPPGADFSGGATVTISNSVITGNRADPTAEVDSGIPCPGFSDGECPYAAALGGGINSWGCLPS